MKRMTRKMRNRNEHRGFEVKVKYLHPTSKLDAPAKVGDSGYDIHSWKSFEIPSAFTSDKPFLIDTGICMQFPKGFSCTVENKSGVSLKKGLLFVNGIVDSGYRGELKLMVYNMTHDTVRIEEGEKIAQLCFYRVATGNVYEASTLEATERGDKGFGSTSEH